MKRKILLITLTAFLIGAEAQLLMNETFNYSTTVLASKPGDPPANADNPDVHVWYNTGKTADSNSASIAIDSEPLYYGEYINSGVGKTAKIDWGGAGANTRVDVIRFISHEEKISGADKKLYYAFMMNVENIKSFSSGADANDWRDVLCIAEGGTNILGNSFRGRFFLQQDVEDPYTVRYSISKNTAFTSSSEPDAFGTISAGQTYLFVIKQTFTGDNTCKVEVMHNPEISGTEPIEGWINGKAADANTFGGTYGVALRRRNLGSTANVLIGGLRVAKTYAEAVGVASGLNNARDNHNIYVKENSIITGVAGKLKVYSLSGTEFVSATTDGQYYTNLSAGNYLVRFTDINGVVSSTKLQIK